MLSKLTDRVARAARRYRGATPRERRLLRRALLAVIQARIAIAVLPFQVVARNAAASRAKAVAPNRPTPGEIAVAIRAAGRFVPRSSCLVQALAGQRLMQRYGHPSQLKIGVARATVGRFGAHAWLEGEDGPLIGEANLGAYTTLLSSPDRG